MCYCYSCFADDASERALQAAFPMWRSMAAANPRLMHFPYSSHLHDRSMYSAMYSNLLGLNNSGVAIPTFALNPAFASGSLASGASGLSAVAATHALYGTPATQESNSGAIYPSSLYHGNSRYQPYISSSSSSQVNKRLDSSLLH